MTLSFNDNCQYTRLHILAKLLLMIAVFKNIWLSVSNLVSTCRKVKYYQLKG